MKPLRYKVKSGDGWVDGAICREAPPPAGSPVIVFDYPTVTRYIVERHEPLSTVEAARDDVQPVRLTLRRDGIVAESKRTRQGIGLDPKWDFLTRLDGIERLAVKYITEKRHLRICHADFETLCAQSGLTVALHEIDLFAYRSTPVTVGNKGVEWNASTCFEGFNDDLCILYVTLPGGTPFLMDSVLLDITKRLVAGHLSEAGGVAAVAEHILGQGYPVTEVLLSRLRSVVQLAIDGIMPPYDAAQDLIKLIASMPEPKPEGRTEGATLRASGPYGVARR